MSTTGTRAEARLTAARFGVALAASAFLVYFGVLLFCDIRRPAVEAEIVLTETGLIVRTVPPESAAASAGLRPGDRIVSLGGRRLSGRLDWLAAEQTLALNRPIPLQVERAGTVVHTALVFHPQGAGYWLKPAGLMLAAVRIVQAVTLAAALLVWWRRPADRVGWLGGWLLAATAVFTVVPPYRLADVWRNLPLPVALMLWGPHLSAVAIGAVMFSFFAVFPRTVLRRPAAWVLAWTPMALALATYVLLVHDMVRHPERHLNGSALAAVILPVTAGYVLAGLALLLHGYRRLEGELERRRARIVVASSVAALMVGLPVVIGYWARSRLELSESLFVSPLFAIGTIWMLIFPLGFTYAILRHRLFDVPALIRQGIEYALARGAVLAIIPLAGLALALDLLIHRSEPVSRILADRGWLYALLFGAAVLARLRRDAWLERLDRRFFREKYNAHQLLRDVAAEIRRAGTFEAAARSVVQRIDMALHPTRVAVLLRAPGAKTCEAIAVAPSDDRVQPLHDSSALIVLLRVIGKPIEVVMREPGGLGAQLPSEAQKWLRGNGIELLVPITLAAEGADALLLLGPRRSEEPYGSDDRDLLQAIADNLALLVETAGAEEDAGPMMECPTCGRCETPATRRCPADAVTLIAARTPRRIGGRYLLERRLARGGMGTVYAAVDTQLGRRVAVKVLRDELVEHPAALSRFEREARLIAALNHPNIVVVHDFGVLPGGAFLVMEYLEGMTLRARLASAGRLRVEEAAALLRGMAAALEAAHARGIVHRDLKPENVFVVQQDSAYTPKILDFGIARLLTEIPASHARSLTRAGELFGTPDYMAPEQAAGETPSLAWDVWALAVIAHEMLTGRLPDETPEGELPAGLRAFFARALSCTPADRPATAGELVTQFDEAVAITSGAAQQP